MARINWKMKRLGDGSYEGWIVLPFGMDDVRAAVAARRQERVVARRNGQPRAIPAGTVVRRHPGRATGRPKPIAVKANGTTPAGAMASAAKLADKIVSNPIVSSMLPPGTGAAVQGVKFLANAAKGGKLADAVGKIVGPGAKRLGDALLSFF